MKISTKISIVLLLLSVACTKSDKNIIKINAEHIIENEASIIELSELSQAIDIITLETNDISLIGKIDDVVFYNDLLIILWEGNCSLFGINGNFLSHIGIRGNGPKEYRYFEYVFVFDNTIILYDSSKNKIFKYNTQGEFIAEHEVPINLRSSRGAYKINDTSIGFYLPDKGYDKNWKIIQMIDLNGAIGDSIVVPSKLMAFSNVNWYFKEGFIVENQQKELRLKYTFNDTIFTINNDNGNYLLTPTFLFELGKYSAVENAREKAFKAMFSSRRYDPFSTMAKIEFLGESNKFLFFGINGNREYFFDKNNMKYYKYEVKYGTSESLRLLKIDSCGNLWGEIEEDNNNVKLIRAYIE